MNDAEFVIDFLTKINLVEIKKIKEAEAKAEAYTK